MKRINGQLTGAREFLELLRKKKRDEDWTVRRLAKFFRVSSAFLGKVLHGDYNPGTKIARKMGFKQVTAFVPIEAAQKGKGNGRKQKKNHQSK